jgi:hypothetical protein
LANLLHLYTAVNSSPKMEGFLERVWQFKLSQQRIFWTRWLQGKHVMNVIFLKRYTWRKGDGKWWKLFWY